MGNALKAFMSKPTTKAGIVVALMFQLIFSVIWMTGYDGVSDNTKNLKIAIVNEDLGMGAKVAEQLRANLPFRTEAIASKESALEKLNDREVHMVMHIPAAFSKTLQKPGEKAQISYTINESNAQLIKSVMQGAATSITAMVNKEAVAAGAQAVLVQANVPAQQAGGMATGLAERVTSDVQSTNKVKDTANQMVPMMMVLASFVGSMIMAMNLQQSSMMVGGAVSKWHQFFARVTIHGVTAVVVAAAGSGLVLALGGQAEGGYLALWAFQALFLFTFMLFAQFFIVLLGMAGMLFNIIGLSVQLVTSGAMIPRELLSSFYHELSRYLPASYAVEGLMNLLFGGPGVGSDAMALAIIAVIFLVGGIGAVAVRKQNPVPAGRPQPSGVAS